MNELLEQLKTSLEKPDVNYDFLKKIQLDRMIYKVDYNRIRNIFEDDTTFSQTLYKLIKKHNDEYKDKCLSKGFELYPNNVLNLIFKHVFNTVKSGSQVVDFNYPGETYYYRGFFFEIIFGQGVVVIIYNENKNVILSI